MKRLIILLVLAFFSACTIQLIVPKEEQVTQEDSLPDVNTLLEDDPEHGGFVVVEGDTIRLANKKVDDLSYLSTIADSIELLTIHGATGSKSWKRFTAQTVSNYIEAADSTDMIDSLAAHRTELADSTAAVRADFPAGGGGGASAINDLTDVTITTPSNTQVLKYNGSAWVNAADAGGGTMTAAQIEDSLATLTYDDRLSVHSIKDKPVYIASEYNVLPDGTDMTSLLSDLLDTLQANNGGTIQFKEGTYRIDGLLRFPNDGTSPPRQKTMKLIGAGSYKAGLGSGTPNGGTIFDLRYSTTSDSARIITNGQGHLSFEDITFLSDNASNSMPFLYTTNTTLSIHECAFYGRNSTFSADETAIKLGAVTTTTSSTGSDDSPFQGYGTVISNNYFNYIERGVHGGTFCNAVVVKDNNFWNRCGGVVAIEWEDIASSQDATGNVISGNLIEMNGYKYGMEFQSFSGNSIMNNNFYDHGDSAIVDLIFHDEAVYNTVVEGFSNFASRVTQESANTNTIVTAQQSSPSEFPQGVIASIGGFETSKTDGAIRINTATDGEWKIRLYNEEYGFNYTPPGGSEANVFKLESTGSGGTSTFELAGTSQNILKAQAGELRLYSANGQALWLGTNQSSAYRAYVVSGGFYSPSSSKSFAMRETGQITWSNTSSPSGTDIQLGRQDDKGFYVKKGNNDLGEINLEAVKIGTDTIKLFSGSGAPEGSKYGTIGSIYLDKTNAKAYLKEDGTGATGWEALSTKTHKILNVTPDNDSTITIDLDNYKGTICQIDMTTASTTKDIVLTASNPETAGVYTFHFQSTGSTNSVNLPSTFLDQTGTALDAGSTYDIDASDVFFTCYFDGTNYYCK